MTGSLRSGRRNIGKIQSGRNFQKRKAADSISDLSAGAWRGSADDSFCIFGGLSLFIRLGIKQPPADKYRLVCEMEVSYPKKYGETERLQYLKTYYQGLVPQDYQGRPLAPSNIVGELVWEGRTQVFLCEYGGFELVRFSPFLAKPLTQNKMGPM